MTKKKYRLLEGGKRFAGNFPGWNSSGRLSSTAFVLNSFVWRHAFDLFRVMFIAPQTLS
jgi:hypothetical protein